MGVGGKGSGLSTGVTKPGSGQKVQTMLGGGGSTPGDGDAPKPSGSQFGSIEDAIAAYQQNNAASAQAFDGLSPYLQQQGYNVARTVVGGGTRASLDALVTSEGQVFDLLIDGEGAHPQWSLRDATGTGYESNRKVVGKDGQFVEFGQWAKEFGGGTGRRPAAPGSSTTGKAQPKGTALGGVEGGDAGYAAGFAASYAAKTRVKHGNKSGRQGTMLGGFKSAAAPASRPATLLGY